MSESVEGPSPVRPIFRTRVVRQLSGQVSGNGTHARGIAERGQALGRKRANSAVPKYDSGPNRGRVRRAKLVRCPTHRGSKRVAAWVAVPKNVRRNRGATRRKAITTRLPGAPKGTPRRILFCALDCAHKGGFGLTSTSRRSRTLLRNVLSLGAGLRPATATGATPGRTAFVACSSRYTSRGGRLLHLFELAP